MALAKEVMRGGFSAGQAGALGGGTNSALAATGSASTDAAPLNASNTIVTGADGTVGVILTGNIGDTQNVFNNSASTLKVYPTSGAAIAVPATGLGTTDAAYSHTTYSQCLYTRISSTQWVVNKSA